MIDGSGKGRLCFARTRIRSLEETDGSWPGREKGAGYGWIGTRQGETARKSQVLISRAWRERHSDRPPASANARRGGRPPGVVGADTIITVAGGDPMSWSGGPRATSCTTPPPPGSGACRGAWVSRQLPCGLLDSSKGGGGLENDPALWRESCGGKLPVSPGVVSSVMRGVSMTLYDMAVWSWPVINASPSQAQGHARRRRSSLPAGRD